MTSLTHEVKTINAMIKMKAENNIYQNKHLVKLPPNDFKELKKELQSLLGKENKIQIKKENLDEPFEKRKKCKEILLPKINPLVKKNANKATNSNNANNASNANNDTNISNSSFSKQLSIIKKRKFKENYNDVEGLLVCNCDLANNSNTENAITASINKKCNNIKTEYNEETHANPTKTLKTQNENKDNMINNPIINTTTSTASNTLNALNAGTKKVSISSKGRCYCNKDSTSIIVACKSNTCPYKFIHQECDEILKIIPAENLSFFYYICKYCRSK